MNETRHIEWKQSWRDHFSKGDLQRFPYGQLREIAREKDWGQVLVTDRLRYNHFMSLHTFTPNLNCLRRPSKFGDQFAKHKIDEARKLTPEQRLLLALELSDAALPQNRISRGSARVSFAARLSTKTVPMEVVDSHER